MTEAVPGRVYFIGAGPGAPDLCTVRGRAVIERADLVLYADSLVHPDLLRWARPEARVVGSAGLTLEEIVSEMVTAARAGGVVARVHSGDPTLYGALREQIERLGAEGIPWEIVPGVSSVFAAAAALGCELTVPGLAQTVVLTRVAKRTDGPDAGQLAGHARPGTTIALFLSLTTVRETVAELLDADWPAETPAAAAYRVTWEDEALLRTTLGELEAAVRQRGWTRHGLILIGPALEPGGEAAQAPGRASLYDPRFSHLFRKGRRA